MIMSMANLSSGKDLTADMEDDLDVRLLFSLL
jgi:hypothetical protein